MFLREKNPKLQLGCNKWNYTQIHTGKNGPNNRTIKKRKIRQFSQQMLKKRPAES